MIDYIKSLPTYVVVIGAIVIYIAIGVIVSYIAGRLGASDDLMSIGVLWLFVVPFLAVIGVLWVFCSPFKAGQKHHKVKKKTNESEEE